MAEKTAIVGAFERYWKGGNECIMPSLFDDFLGKMGATAFYQNFEYHGEIYHYTALKNIEPILLNSQNQIVLWASQSDCLNDISEGKVVEQRYHEVCKSLWDDGVISRKFYNLLKHITPSRNELFYLLQSDAIRAYRGEYTTYIASFSKNNDLLPMWNYYSKGDMFEGVNLGLDASTISFNFGHSFADGKVKVSISPVIYDPEEQKQVIRSFLLEVVKNYEEQFDSSVRALVSMRLTSWKMLFKQACFCHEQEVRIIVDIANKYSGILPVKYRTNSGYIIPYVEIKIDKSALRSVTLGPFRGTESQIKLQESILSQMLTSNQYYAKINVSNVPVRY